jgi:glycosyltransferase involved in cell wall biosynthesis
MLRALVKGKGLSDQVELAGTVTGNALVRALNAHTVLVVPSRWREPFGVVAVEGIACGCVVVASAGGGLSDAVGACGIVFERGNIASLAKALATVLSDANLRRACRTAAPEHLARYRQKHVAANYLRVMAAAVRN